MAATRKLQGEIERCLKKVSEGVETFEDTWQKVHNATNSNQKEKYEADLKKEIKKLQRMRDQIKTWIASAEIKDKSALLDHRKLIETQMERFKVVERETKTKAYSKEGLGAAQKLDPAQREREDLTVWLNTTINSLNLQIDSRESEIESLMAGKKKKLDKEKQDRIEALKFRVEKHRYHIRKLETLLRMLTNMSVEAEQISKIKEDIEYYMDYCNEPDFADDEYIYDDIQGMDEVELGVNLQGDSNDGGSPTSLVSLSSPIPITTSSPPPTIRPTSSSSSSLPSSLNNNSTVVGVGVNNNNNNNHSSSEASSEEGRKRVSSGSAGVNSSKQQAIEESSKPVRPTAVRPTTTSTTTTAVTTTTITTNNNLSLVTTTNSQHSGANKLTNATPAKPVPGSMAHTTPNNSSPSSGLLSNHVSGNFATVAAATTTNISQNKPSSVSSSESSASSWSSSSPAPATQSLGAQISSSAATTAVSTSTTQIAKTSINSYGPGSPSPLSVSSAPSPQPIMPPSSGLAVLRPGSLPSQPPIGSQTQIISNPHSILNGPLLNKVPEGMSSLKNIAQQVIDRAGIEAPISEQNRGIYDGPVGSPPTVTILKAHQQQNVAPTSMQTGRSSPVYTNTQEVRIPPLLGVAPLGPLPLQKEHQFQLQMLEAAYYHIPHPSDSEKLRPYLPRNPCVTPPYYPQNLLMHSDTVEFFQRLSTESLFFIFYYMEGTKAQYLAAKALKKQSWRFHTKYMMWFQRHEEPKVINEEYEQGTYIYFDFEKWSQRKKEGFTFEYKYLEDRELN